MVTIISIITIEILIYKKSNKNLKLQLEDFYWPYLEFHPYTLEASFAKSNQTTFTTHIFPWDYQ